MNANTKKYENLLADFLKFKEEKLQLDLTRGKPSLSNLTYRIASTEYSMVIFIEKWRRR